MNIIRATLLIFALLSVPFAYAGTSLTVDDVITIADILDEREEILSSCSLSMEVNGITCSCSGTTCSSSGTGQNTQLTCSDSQGTTTCSIAPNGTSCSCTTVSTKPIKPIDPIPIDPVSILD